jgi:hypothetical protein
VNRHVYSSSDDHAMISRLESHASRLYLSLLGGWLARCTRMSALCLSPWVGLPMYATSTRTSRSKPYTVHNCDNESLPRRRWCVLAAQRHLVLLEVAEHCGGVGYRSHWPNYSFEPVPSPIGRDHYIRSMHRKTRPHVANSRAAVAHFENP